MTTIAASAEDIAFGGDSDDDDDDGYDELGDGTARTGRSGGSRGGWCALSTRGTCGARLWGTRTARICIVPMSIVRPARILQMVVIVVTCCFGVGAHLGPAALGRARDARDLRTAPVVAFRTTLPGVVAALVLMDALAY